MLRLGPILIIVIISFSAYHINFSIDFQNAVVVSLCHWLPVKYHIDFKILLLTFKSFHNRTPHSLSDLLHIATPSCTLRCSSSFTLIVPPARLTTMGFRVFSQVATHLWNSLPHHICNTDFFTSTLKSVLKHSVLPLSILFDFSLYLLKILLNTTGVMLFNLQINQRFKTTLSTQN